MQCIRCTAVSRHQHHQSERITTCTRWDQSIILLSFISSNTTLDAANNSSRLPHLEIFLKGSAPKGDVPGFSSHTFISLLYIEKCIRKRWPSARGLVAFLIQISYSNGWVNPCDVWLCPLWVNTQRDNTTAWRREIGPRQCLFVDFYIRWGTITYADALGRKSVFGWSTLWSFGIIYDTGSNHMFTELSVLFLFL